LKRLKPLNVSVADRYPQCWWSTVLSWSFSFERVRSGSDKRLYYACMVLSYLFKFWALSFAWLWCAHQSTYIYICLQISYNRRWNSKLWNYGLDSVRSFRIVFLVVCFCQDPPDVIIHALFYPSRSLVLHLLIWLYFFVNLILLMIIINDQIPFWKRWDNINSADGTYNDFCIGCRTGWKLPLLLSVKGLENITDQAIHSVSIWRKIYNFLGLQDQPIWAGYFFLCLREIHIAFSQWPVFVCSFTKHQRWNNTTLTLVFCRWYWMLSVSLETHAMKAVLHIHSS